MLLRFGRSNCRVGDDNEKLELWKEERALEGEKRGRGEDGERRPEKRDGEEIEVSSGEGLLEERDRPKEEGVEGDFAESMKYDKEGLEA
jgi:hypothetical protein